MKAILYHHYGPPDVLKYEDTEKPTPRDDGVLMKVRAAAVNPLDWHLMRGTPYMIRTQSGLRKPKATGLGADVAGQVESVGSKVTQFKPGDDVFGFCTTGNWVDKASGAFAEYACASESGLVIKPENVTFEQAASAPVAALSALQALRDYGHIQPGQKVLVNGAAGGVGTFAVQIAKSLGADVTGVCSTRNVELVRSIGAERVIDYTQEDFTRSAQRYDLFFDCIANHSLLACRRVLTPQGIYVPVGGEAGLWMIGTLARALTAPVLSRFVSQKLVTFFLAKSNQADLTIIGELLQTGKVKPVIDRRYTLSETPEAVRYLEQGHARGKVIIAP